MGITLNRRIAPALLALSALLAAGQGCFVTTDENLWRQRREAGPDAPVADVSHVEGGGDRGADGPVVDAPVTDLTPWTDGPRPEGPTIDTTPTPDSPPQPDTGKLPNGTACSSGSVCSTGFCEDGVCCNSACKGPCQACDLTGTEGTCTPYPAGTDPDSECAQDPVATCGLDGSCDGNFGCRKYVAGTVCAAAACATAQTYSVKKCSGTGSCVASTAVACEPYKCDSTTGQCYSSCFSDAQCYLYRCNTATSACYSKCTSSSQCQTGYKCIGTGTCK